MVPGPATIVPSGSPSLTLGAPGASSSGGTWDDAISAPIALPFVFNYPGGSTSTITISSNGGVYLASVTSGSYETTGASYGSIIPFREQPARICAYFHDLDPSAGGTLKYDVDPLNQYVRITWNLVPEWALPPVPTALNTMQVTLEASGNVSIAYGALANIGVANGNNAIAGFTPGSGSRLGPAIDISMSLPLTTGDGQVPSILRMDARPVLGTTPNIITSNVIPGTILQVLAVGETFPPMPVDLGVIGMPLCNLYINPVVLLTNVINVMTGTFIVPLGIPNMAVFQNYQLALQAFPLSPGLNSLGLVGANGVCARLGL